MTKQLTEAEQDAEILRVIKAIGRPIPARALHLLFDEITPTMVNQSVWRYMGTKVELDYEMRIIWKRK